MNERSDLAMIVEDVWVASRPLRFLSVETGTRMTVVRLADGGLFVHSPISLAGGMREAVDALGPVKAVVAPSLFHHLHVGEWIDAYPQAVVCACPGLAAKRADLRWGPTLGDEPEPAWRGEIDQVFFSARTLENEVVFFHRASCDADLRRRHLQPVHPPGALDPRGRAAPRQPGARLDPARAPDDAAARGGPGAGRSHAGLEARAHRVGARRLGRERRHRGAAARLQLAVTTRRILVAAAVAVAIGVGSAVHLVLVGSVEGLSLPSREETPYVLPWAVGEAHHCSQGNQSLATHRGEHSAAWDFSMWLGTPVLAARAGVVEEAVDRRANRPNLAGGNYVSVRHGDGSLAIYAHVDGRTLRVRPGDAVEQRQHLADAGMSGRTLHPHLHFFVRDAAGEPAPVVFREVEPDGVPRMWQAYTAR